MKPSASPSKFTNKEVIILNNILEEIKNNIKNQGLKKQYIAKQLNISNQSFLYKLNNNTFKTDELFKISAILNIDLNKFKEA